MNSIVATAWYHDSIIIKWPLHIYIYTYINMLVIELHRLVYDEVSALKFLQSFGIFAEESFPSLRTKKRKCNGIMNIKIRNTKKKIDGVITKVRTPTWRCGKKCCQIRRSIRSTNSFFKFRTLQEIVVLVYEWLYGNSLQVMITWKSRLTGRGQLEMSHCEF